MFSKLITNF